MRFRSLSLGIVCAAAVQVLLCTYAAGQTTDASEDRIKVAALSKPSESIPTGRETTPKTGGEFELGVGDVVHVSVWREQELTLTAVVRPDGRISIPLAGEVQVAGKTALDAQALIRTLLLKYVTDPQVTLSVLEIHSRQVFITGQVQRPGAYPLPGSCTVLQLIASAGGLTPYAHRKSIVVLDGSSKQIAQFDYAKAIRGDKKQGRLLQPGDTVVVP